VSEFEVRRRTTAGSLRYGREKLLEAHAELEAAGADLGPLTKILGIALALDGLAANAEAEVVQASRTAGGLSAKVALLSQQLRSAEDELGRLRPENATLRARAAALESGRCLDRAAVAETAVKAVEDALGRDGEYLRLAHREKVVEAVLAVVDGMAWVA
jgi:cell division protein FtsB